jgi:hypothetical protein
MLADDAAGQRPLLRVRRDAAISDQEGVPSRPDARVP